MSTIKPAAGDAPDVLTVEDDPDIALTLRLRLKMNGYGVRHAGDGAAAMAAAKERRPDLVIMDVSLPGEDGFEIAARFRREPGLRDVPIILLTASMRPDMEERASEAGAAAFLRKPYDGELLLQCVRRFAVAAPARAQGPPRSTRPECGAPPKGIERNSQA